jgi:hypothetical protein
MTPRERDRSDDEFFVGYLAETPPGIGSFVRRATGIAVSLAVLAALVVAGLQERFSPAVFEFGAARALEGVVSLDPVPRLRVSRPGLPGTGVAAETSYLLGVFGKRGAREAVADLDGRRVALRGALFYSDGQPGAEIEDGSVQSLGATTEPSELSLSLGTVDLVGEIVDSKCYSGVMKPGSGRTHRACAERCLSGGVPAFFVVRAADGQRRVLLPVGADERPMGRELLAWVGEPLRVTGELRRLGDLWLLVAETEAYRRAEAGS